MYDLWFMVFEVYEGRLGRGTGAMIPLYTSRLFEFECQRILMFILLEIILLTERWDSSK